MTDISQGEQMLKLRRQVTTSISSSRGFILKVIRESFAILVPEADTVVSDGFLQVLLVPRSLQRAEKQELAPAEVAQHAGSPVECPPEARKELLHEACQKVLLETAPKSWQM